MILAKHETDVLVAGGGPVGLFTALSLAQAGVRCEVLEEQWKTASRSYALALHPESLRLLDELELTQTLLAGGNMVQVLGLYGDGKKRGEINMSGLSGKFPYVLVLPQQQLEEILLERLSALGVKIHWNHRLSRLQQNGGGVTAKVEKLAKESTGYSVTRTEWVVDRELEIGCRFLVGADGHRSLVRRSLGIDFPERGTPSTFAVFEFTTLGPAGREIQIVVDEKSTSVLWPLPEGRFRWSFELSGFRAALDPRLKSRLFVQFRDQPFPHVEEERLEALILDRAPWFDVKVVEVVWSAAIRFERRLAARFGAGRVWFVGDAAHLALPIGIQSMNVGLREAADLTTRIAAVLKGGEDVGTLESFNDRWCEEWRALLRLADHPAATAEATGWVKERAGRIPHCVPASGDDLLALAAQIGIEASEG
jgi:2-polyprenyl-6-methoxyphenol hydroxylase-like FAD-dependent oxidoreductase